jgi:hypothetical protein
MVFPGWLIARAIPPEVLTGLITGQYKLYGGVIRWAAGTANAGQIVRHLIPASTNLLNTIPGLGFIPGIIANLQLNELKDITQYKTYQLTQLAGQVQSLSQTTQQVLQIATGTAVLSGLGLAVSSIGFIAINTKLNTIDSKLKEIQKDVKAIRCFLESTERARLCAALNGLLKVDENTAPEHRHTILHTSRTTLAEINMRYCKLLEEATTIETAMANEEYFSLTALAHVRCTAELGMFDVAYKEMDEANAFWQSQARRVVKEILLGDYPQRFLATDFVEDVSVAELVEWLDFVEDEQKGFIRLDELRRKLDESWYSKGWFGESSSGLNRNIGIGLEKEQKMLIPALRKLVARSNVFEGFVAQYQTFESQKIKPSEFEQKIAALPQSSVVEEYLILEPEKRAAVTLPTAKSSKSNQDRRF